MIRTFFLVLLISTFISSQSPLTRSFSPSSTSRHQIRLTLRTELRGQTPIKIGIRHYLEPFARAAEQELSWVATRRVLSVSPDGSAEIEESLSDFFRSAPIAPAPDDETPPDPDAEKLAASLSAIFDRFSSPATFRYRESRDGRLHALTPASAPQLGESSPPVLTLWLLRALRPTSALPDAPLRFGDRWSAPRAATLENWSDVSGSESGEWLTSTSLEPAARLLVTQFLSAKVSAGPDLAPEGRSHATFHSESLSTLELSTARLLSAERSASREITWLLNPFPLPKPPAAAAPPAPLQPEFRARLSARIQISLCNPDCPR